MTEDQELLINTLASCLVYFVKHHDTLDHSSDRGAVAAAEESIAEARETIDSEILRL